MATSFDDVKTNIPGVGWRAYVFSRYTELTGPCSNDEPPFPLSSGWPGWACTYLAGWASVSSWGPADSWGVTGPPGVGPHPRPYPMNGVFPSIGEFVSIQIPGSPFGGTAICLKVVDIVDEDTFNNGTCVACYNNGNGGNCSDTWTPNDPNGCRYNNSINPLGIRSAAFMFSVPSNSQYTTFLTNDCGGCVNHTPPVFEPNMIVNCCDPSEKYQISTGYYNPLLEITGTGVNHLGVTNFTQAFRADLYTGGNNTGYKCWHLTEEHPPFGPTVYTITFDPVQKYPDCGHLNYHITTLGHDPCCGVEPDSGCTSNNLQTLQTSLDFFSVWRDNLLNP